MFKYEPSWSHTSRTFNARMDARMKEARKDQTAILFLQELDKSEGSVNSAPAVVYMQDWDGQIDLFDAPGG